MFSRVPDERVPEAAAVGFSRVAADYERHRPGYPTALLDRVAAAVGIGPGRTVVDVGAGTGKLTRLLLRYGCDVAAVEPLAEMRAQLAEVLPDVQALDGTAEAMPLADASVDVVTAGQAFHWFDTERALDEFHRVLRPGGWLVLVWNDRAGDGWMTELTDVCDALLGNPDEDDRFWAVIEADRRFGAVQNHEESVVERTTPAWVVETMATRSWIASLDEAERAELLERIREFLATHPETAGLDEVVHEHPCRAYWCQRI